MNKAKPIITNPFSNAHSCNSCYKVVRSKEETVIDKLETTYIKLFITTAMHCLRDYICSWFS